MSRLGTRGAREDLVSSEALQGPSSNPVTKGGVKQGDPPPYPLPVVSLLPLLYNITSLGWQGGTDHLLPLCRCLPALTLFQSHLELHVLTTCHLCPLPPSLPYLIRDLPFPTPPDTDHNHSALESGLGMALAGNCSHLAGAGSGG